MEITFKGTTVQLEGSELKVGDQAPAFALENLSGKQITTDSLKGKVTIISVFPKINTRVCDQQTRRFNEMASTIEGVRLISISKNDKDELSDWCAAEGLDMEMLVDDGSFGKAFGVYMPEIDLLARSVFVLDETGLLGYKEILPEAGGPEPNYEAAVEAAKDLV